MKTYTYYYLEEETGCTVVTSIAKSGKITSYEHKALKKPHLFSTIEEVNNTIEKSQGMSYYYCDGDGKKHNCFMTWVVKKLSITL